MKDLFGNNVPEPTPITRTPSGRLKHHPENWRAVELHAKLCKEHGTIADKICGGCEHFIEKHFSKTYFKCEKIAKVDSANPSTDHRKRWPACGLYKERIEE